MPVIPFEEREAIVAAIKYVDQVVTQTSLDKLAAWEQLHFDVVFHGDDWKGTKLYSDIEEVLHSVGCDVVYLPHTDGISSSLLSKKLTGMEDTE